MVSTRRTKVSGRYISGLSSPVSVDGDGGFSLSEGDDYVASIVRTALLPHESSNPFMNGGLSQRAIFQNGSDPVSTGRLLAQIRAIFERLDRENIAELVSVRQLSLEGGELKVEVVYINKENNKRSEITTVVDASRKVGLL